jgi:hypothetical protein
LTFNLCHVHVRTDKPREVADWWTRAFHLDPVGDGAAPCPGPSVACRSRNGLDLQFTDLGRGNYDPIPPPGPVPYARLDHIGFALSDLDADHEHLIDLGAVRQPAPNGGPGAPGLYHFIQAPGNVLIELHPVPAGWSESRGPHTIPALNHVHIRTEEPRQVADWWVEAFELTMLRDFVADWGGHTVSCRSQDGMGVSFSNLGRALYDPHPPPTPVPYARLDHLGFATEAIDDEAERLASIGAERCLDATGSPNRPGRWQFLRVPGNVTIELRPKGNVDA